MKALASTAVLCLSLTIGAAAGEPYVPGLGEIMAATQMRHQKLWFAGTARNWALAGYELDELEEGFHDVATYQPALKNGAASAVLLGRLVGPPLAELRRVVGGREAGAFARAFDRLTAACNACHHEAGMGFIAITRPTAPGFSNQRFR